MPYFYDLEHTSTSSTATMVETQPHLFCKQAVNGETLGIYGMYASGRQTAGTPGGGTFRLRDYTSSTGGVATGGTNQVPRPKNVRGSVAATSTWNNDASAISTAPAGTVVYRVIAGFAQTGGQGGYVPIVPTQAVQLMTGSTVNNNPTDLEWTSIAFSTSCQFDWLIDIGEGV
jgi:hypothetical protein